ncbi:MFS transporter [Sedimentitalea arenosa]|uniref:MFS transporter n=1 Tax=Sedimentitalea arenosa TaxID=2798803 RepID=A0A8J7J5N5_9RHOB|nr:MFS transporter [Arenibacterium arenosum]MBJ6371990.1 MFS transporter [Arenibacterium arenosum]
MSMLAFLSRNAPWLAAGGLLTFLSSFGQTFFISIFAGEIRAEFGLSHGAWGGIYSLGTAASAVVMIWSGALTDLFRVRVMGPIVLLGLATACIAMALNPVVWALPLVIFALRLFGQGMSSHIAVVAMSRWFIATRGRALSIATMGFALGEAALPVSFVAVMAMMDWHLLWLVSSVIVLAAIPVLMLLLRQERTPQSMAQESASTGMQGRHWTRRQALRHPLFWTMVPAILGPAAFNTAFFFHQVHFAEIKDISHVELVAFFPLYTGMGIAAMFASGWALDRLGTARLMPFYQLPMVVSFIAFSLATGPLGAMIGFLFLAITTGANSTLPNAFWAEFYGTAHIGAIKAMAAAVMVLGSAIGPGLTGLLIDLGIGLETQFIGVAAYFLFTTAMMMIGIGRARVDLLP